MAVIELDPTAAGYSATDAEEVANLLGDAQTNDNYLDPASSLPTASAALLGRIFNLHGQNYRCEILAAGTSRSVTFDEKTDGDDVGLFWGRANDADLRWRQAGGNPSNKQDGDVWFGTGSLTFVEYDDSSGTGRDEHLAHPPNWLGYYSTESEANAAVTAVDQIVIYGQTIAKVTAYTADTDTTYTWRAYNIEVVHVNSLPALSDVSSDDAHKIYAVNSGNGIATLAHLRPIPEGDSLIATLSSGWNGNYSHLGDERGFRQGTYGSLNPRRNIVRITEERSSTGSTRYIVIPDSSDTTPLPLATVDQRIILFIRVKGSTDNWYRSGLTRYDASTDGRYTGAYANGRVNLTPGSEFEVAILWNNGTANSWPYTGTDSGSPDLPDAPTGWDWIPFYPHNLQWAELVDVDQFDLARAHIDTSITGIEAINARRNTIPATSLSWDSTDSRLTVSYDTDGGTPRDGDVILLGEIPSGLTATTGTVEIRLGTDSTTDGDLKTQSGRDVIPNELIEGKTYMVVRDGGDYVVVSPAVGDTPVSETAVFETLFEHTTDQTFANDTWINFDVSHGLTTDDDTKDLIFGIRADGSTNAWEYYYTPARQFRELPFFTGAASGAGSMGTGVPHIMLKTARGGNSISWNDFGHEILRVTKQDANTWRFGSNNMSSWDRLVVLLVPRIASSPRRSIIPSSSLAYDSTNNRLTFSYNSAVGSVEENDLLLLGPIPSGMTDTTNTIQIRLGTDSTTDGNLRDHTLTNVTAADLIENRTYLVQVNASTYTIIAPETGLGSSEQSDSGSTTVTGTFVQWRLYTYSDVEPVVSASTAPIPENGAWTNNLGIWLRPGDSTSGQTTTDQRWILEGQGFTTDDGTLENVQVDVYADVGYEAYSSEADPDVATDSDWHDTWMSGDLWRRYRGHDGGYKRQRIAGTSNITYITLFDDTIYPTSGTNRVKSLDNNLQNMQNGFIVLEAFGFQNFQSGSPNNLNTRQVAIIHRPTNGWVEGNPEAQRPEWHIQYKADEYLLAMPRESDEQTPTLTTSGDYDDNDQQIGFILRFDNSDSGTTDVANQIEGRDFTSTYNRFWWKVTLITTQ